MSIKNAIETIHKELEDVKIAGAQLSDECYRYMLNGIVRDITMLQQHASSLYYRGENNALVGASSVTDAQPIPQNAAVAGYEAAPITDTTAPEGPVDVQLPQ